MSIEQKFEAKTEPVPIKSFDAEKSKFLLLIFGPFLSLPPVPITLFNLSLVISLIAMIILFLFGDRITKDFTQILTNSNIAHLASTIYFDPLLWGFLIILITSVLMLLSSRIVHPYKYYSTIIGAALPFVVYFLVWVVGDKIIKPAFLVSRPSPEWPEPPITAFVRTLLGSNDTGDSMPSGFVMRQMAAFLFLLWILFNKRAGRILPRWLRIIVTFVNAIGLLIVSVSRIILNAHTLLDVSVAIAVGAIVFWMIMLPIYSLLYIRGVSINRIYLSTIAISCLFVFVFIIGFSKIPSKLIQLEAFSIIYLGILFSISPAIEISRIKWTYRDRLIKK